MTVSSYNEFSQGATYPNDESNLPQLAETSTFIGYTGFTNGVDKSSSYFIIPVNLNDYVSVAFSGQTVISYMAVSYEFVTASYLSTYISDFYSLGLGGPYLGGSIISSASQNVGTVNANIDGGFNSGSGFVNASSGYLLIQVYGDPSDGLQKFTLSMSGSSSGNPSQPSQPNQPTYETWNGPNGGDFGNPANWSAGVVPGSSMNVNIGAGSTVNSSGVYEVSALQLSTNGTFNINNGAIVGDVSIVNEGTINDSGSLQANPFRSSAYILNYGTIVITVPAASLTAPSGRNYGNMVAHGGLIDFDPLSNYGTMSVDSGGEISVTGATVDNGTISANSGGTVYLGGAVTQTSSPVTSANGHDTSGELNINGGSVVLGGADSDSVCFQSGGYLTIDQLSAFTGVIIIADNPASDVIDLPGTVITRAYNAGPNGSVNQTTLVLTESNGAAVALSIENLGFNYAVAIPDGNGGTVIGFEPGTATDMLMRSSVTGALEIYDLDSNTIQGAAALGQVGQEWQVAGYGDFSGNPGEADMLMRSSKTGALEYYDLSNNRITAAGPMGQVGLEWSVAGFGDFSGNANETDMLMRNSKTGALEIYDIRGNSIVGASGMGQVGLEWSVAGFGDFSGNANETDMLIRNSNTGAFEIYDIRGNGIVGAAAMGQVGSEWSVAGFGDFSGRANETDMLMRNSNTGAFEIYDITNNRITSAASMGQVGLEWQVVGFGAFGLNPGESDMLMRSTKTGALEVYDITSNTIVSAASMGQVGLEWQNNGIAAPPPNGTSAAPAQLAQSMASFAPAGAALDGATQFAPAIMGGAAPSLLAAPTGPIPQA